MQLAAGRAVAVVLELVVVAWIRGSVEVPSPGRSCELFDASTGRGGPEGERHDVFARSGLNSIGILFCRSPNDQDLDPPLE